MYIETIKNWANSNQGFLAIILFFVSLIIGWMSGFFNWFLGKLKRRAPYINTGEDNKVAGDISVGNKIFIQKSGKNSTNVQSENITLNKYDNIT